MNSFDDCASFIAACIQEALASGRKDAFEIRGHIDEQIAGLSELERKAIEATLLAMLSSDDPLTFRRKLH